MALKTRDFARADGYLKEALESQPDNVDLRALYTYFLVESNQVKFARDFVTVTLNKHDKSDVYGMCAYGSLVYTQARENKQSGAEAAHDRNVKFLRAAECFDKALQLDAHCTFAAQGIAIALAENVLAGTPAGLATTQANGQAEAALRIKNTRDALSILIKVRESLSDASVYINLGHCHYARDEFERAIENVRFTLVRGRTGSLFAGSTRPRPNGSTTTATCPSCSTSPGPGSKRRSRTRASPPCRAPSRTLRRPKPLRPPILPSRSTSL